MFSLSYWEKIEYLERDNIYVHKLSSTIFASRHALYNTNHILV